MKHRKLSSRFRIDDGKGFRLKDWHPQDTAGLDKRKAEPEALLREGVKRMTELQDMLYAQDRWALLLIFQAMDAAGKDSAIKHVMSGVNPQGCHVTSFKAPSAEELDHDFMWRCQTRLPGRGTIGIFNRSYYEEVLVVRVHPEILGRQKLPPPLLTKRIWKDRFEDINAFERHMARNGTVVRKFFLHVSREEQRKRFLERIADPEKNWKFEPADVGERQHWDDYMAAYEDMIRNTATPDAPWYVVPADRKWFTRIVVARAIIAALEELDLHYPQPDTAKREHLASARAELENEQSD